MNVTDLSLNRLLVSARSLRFVRSLGPIRPFGAIRSVRSVWPLWSLESVGALEFFRPVLAIHLCSTSIVPPFPTMLTGNAVRAIKPAQFAAGIGPEVVTTILPPIYLSIFPSILTPIELTVLSSIFTSVKSPFFAAIFPPVFLPHISRLGI